MGGTLINYPSPSDLNELLSGHADEIGVDKNALSEITLLFSELRRQGKNNRKETLVSEAILRVLSERKIPTNAGVVSEILWKIFLVGFSNHASMVDGASEILSALRKSGRILGVVSNTPFPGSFHIHDFQRLGLPIESFSTFVWSSEFGKRKPDVEIFNKALTDIGIQPTHTIHVGDKISRDIEGASAAGIIPVWFDRKGDEWNYKGHRITSLLELPQLTDKIERGS